MKGKIFIFGILILVGVCVMCMMNSNNKKFVQNDKSDESEQMMKEKDTLTLDTIDIVDQQIQSLLESDMYKEESKDVKVTLVSDLLNKLKSKGYIKNVSLNKEQTLFSFQYEDGTLGGVTFQEFEQGLDELPMN